MGDLIRAGALDGFGVPKRQLLWTLGGLHYAEDALVEAPDAPADLPDLTEREAMAWDYELLGLSPDDHPLRLWRARLRSQGVLSAAELATQPAGKLVKVAGMVVVRQAPPTAHHHLFITLEDETGLVNLIIRPDLIRTGAGHAASRDAAPDRGAVTARRCGDQCVSASHTVGRSLTANAGFSPNLKPSPHRSAQSGKLSLTITAALPTCKRIIVPRDLPQSPRPNKQAGPAIG